MGKKVLRLFLETMLRAVVIILAVGIVVIGALLIKTLVKNNSLKDSKKTTTGKEIVTEAEDENDPTFNNGDDENSGSDGADETGAVASTDAKILVINATGTSGVAAGLLLSWQNIYIRSIIKGMDLYFLIFTLFAAPALLMIFLYAESFFFGTLIVAFLLIFANADFPIFFVLILLLLIVIVFNLLSP